MEIKLKSIKGDKLEALKASIDYAYDKAVAGRDEVSKRYQDSYKYFLGQLPGMRGDEDKTTVEPVLRRAVEKVKPSLMNIFTENEKKAVSLHSPLLDNETATLVNEYINKVFLKDNDGYKILDKAISEALIAGDTFTKSFVKESSDTKEYDYSEGISPEALAIVLSEYSEDEVANKVGDLEERDGMLYGKIELTKHTTSIAVEHVPVSDFLISGVFEEMDEYRYMCHRIRKTIGELVDLGFDYDKLINSTSPAGGADSFMSNSKLLTGGVFTSESADVGSGDPMEREIYLFEHYIYSSLLDNKKKSKLYQVFATDVDILKITQVPFTPFDHGVPERLPGSFWGVSLYDKFAQSQDVLSYALRDSQRNAANATLGRWMAVKGSYDRQTMLNNRPGGIVEIQSPGAITPMQYHELPQSHFEIVQSVREGANTDMLSATGIDVTGANMSATASAITANSADMRDKIIAKSLAYTLIRPLFARIYSIIRSENLPLGAVPDTSVPMQPGMPPVMKVITGNMLPVSTEFRIDVNTVNDDTVLANQLIQLGNTFATWAQSPNPIMSPAGMVSIAKKITGMDDTEIAEYFSVPAPVPPTPEQMAMTQLELETKQLGNEMLKANVALATAQATSFVEDSKTKIEKNLAEIRRLEEQTVLDYKTLELNTHKVYEDLDIKRDELMAEIRTSGAISLS